MTSPDVDGGQVNRVSIKPPPFWKVDPKVWFLQLEAQFQIANITADLTKFNYVVSAIDSEVLSQVMDVLNAPPASGKYDAIKDKLISVYSDSNEQRLRRLLSGLELGDKKPSQLLNEMKRLGGTSVPDELLSTLWTQRLPTQIQSVLATSSDSLCNLAKMADKIAEIEQPRTCAVSESANLVETVQQLVREVAALKISFQSAPPSPPSPFHSARPRSRSTSTNRESRKNNGTCWYHNRFKDAARKCVAPCIYFNSTPSTLAHSENQSPRP